MKISEQIYRSYTDHLLDGRRQHCAGILKELLDEKIQIRTIYEELFQKSLYEVGELWEKNKISVAVEHLATSITSTLMNVIYPLLFGHGNQNKKAIISAVANEYHQIGGKMVADIMELSGWNTYYLGANTPINDFLNLVESKEPQLVGLSLALYSNTPSLFKVLRTLNRHYPKLQILIGGQAFKWGGVGFTSAFDNVKYLSSLQELENYLTKLPVNG